MKSIPSVLLKFILWSVIISVFLNVVNTVFGYQPVNTLSAVKILVIPFCVFYFWPTKFFIRVRRTLQDA